MVVMCNGNGNTFMSLSNGLMNIATWWDILAIKNQLCIIFFHNRLFRYDYKSVFLFSIIQSFYPSFVCFLNRIYLLYFYSWWCFELIGWLSLFVPL